MMTRLFKWSIAATFLVAGGLFGAAVAFGGNGTISVLDSSGAARTYDVVTDSSGNYVSKIVLCDEAAGANCAGVDANNAAKQNLAEVGGVAVALPLPTTPELSTGNGWTPFLANGLTTTVKAVKATAGELGGYYCWNPNSAVAYVQIFDATSVTLGTTTPKWSIGIPPTAAANLEFSMGLHFANAIQVAATTTATGSTAPTTALDCNFAYN